ncbi:hypothetical protein [Flavobacterium sp. GNP001]
MRRGSILLTIILFHVLIGFMGYAIPFTAKYMAMEYFYMEINVIKNQNRNNEALLAAAYIVGSEVFLRMTDGNPLYEISKYAVMVFLLIGMYYSGFSKKCSTLLDFPIISARNYFGNS